MVGVGSPAVYGALRGGIVKTFVRTLAAGVLAFGFSAAVPAPSFAQETPPDEAALRARYDTLFEEMLARPADLDLMFAFAEVATRLGEYDAAISTLERMLLFNPNLPRVHLELGALYMRVGANEMARTYLEDAVRGPDVPEAVRQRVETLLAEIDRRTSRHVFGGSVLAGIRYQTNANAGPNSSRVLVGGIDAVLDDEFREQDDFNSFVSALLVHAYDLDTPYGEFWETRVGAYGAAQFQLDDLDVSAFELQTGPRLALFPAEMSGTTIRPFVLGNVVTLNYDLLYTGIGFGAELRHVVSDRLRFELQPFLVYREFNNSSTEPTADRLSGVESGVILAGRYRPMDDLEVFARLGYSHENAKAAFEENDQYAVTAGATYAYPAPFGLTPVPWEITAEAGFTATDYKEPDPAIAPGRTRHDEEWWIGVHNSFRMTEAWSLEAQLRYIVNESNIRNFDRDNLVVLFGALATF